MYTLLVITNETQMGFVSYYLVVRSLVNGVFLGIIIEGEYHDMRNKKVPMCRTLEMDNALDVVRAANIHDSKGAKQVLEKLSRSKHDEPYLEQIFGDAGYRGKLI